MAASPGLLLETARAEATYAEVQRNIDDLSRQYRIREGQELAELEEKLAATNAQFEAQRAEITGQLQPSVRESVERLLLQNRDLEIEKLKRTHQEKADERKQQYDKRKLQYDQELYAALSAVMNVKVSRLLYSFSSVPVLMLIQYSLL